MNGSSKIKQFAVSTVLAVGMTFSLAAGGQKDITPAGTDAILTADYKSIQDITLDGIASYTIKEGSSFSLEIKGDKAFVDAVSVENNNSYLKVVAHADRPVDVTITAPFLESLNISGGSEGTMAGYDMDRALALYVSDDSSLTIQGELATPELYLFAFGSELKGSVKTHFLILEAHGDADVTLSGSATVLNTVLVSNSNTVLDGLSIKDADLKLENSAVLTADFLGVSNVKIDAFANSSIKLAMDGILSADIFGDSALIYSGDVTWAGKHVADNEDDDAFIKMM